VEPRFCLVSGLLGSFVDWYYNTIYTIVFALFMPDSDGFNGFGCGEFNSAQTLNMALYSACL